jgi:hypothetical protein
LYLHINPQFFSVTRFDKMQWAYTAIWSGWFIHLIQSQIVPGSYLGFPNCTVRIYPPYSNFLSNGKHLG